MLIFTDKIGGENFLKKNLIRKIIDKSMASSLSPRFGKNMARVLPIGLQLNQLL
jgi:hypothetical protein